MEQASSTLRAGGIALARAAGVLGVVLFLAGTSAGLSQAQQPLSSWADTPTKARIMDFIRRVTTAGSPDFVAPEDRIATFDMDGTVLTEKPISTQTLILMMQACVIGSNEPKRIDQTPFKQACGKQYAYFADYTKDQTLRDVAAGRTQAAFRKYAESALKLARHPGFDRPLGEMIYTPMVELARYLQSRGFSLYFVSGSMQPLVREVAELRFDLPRAHGIGTQWPLTFDPNPEGAPVFRWKAGSIRLPGVFGPGKPLAILRHIGKPPVFAAGNTMGDNDMLLLATKRKGPGMGIVIVHDDAKREYAYADTKIEASARANGWSLVSMKNDFRIIFPR